RPGVGTETSKKPVIYRTFTWRIGCFQRRWDLLSRPTERGVPTMRKTLMLIMAGLAALLVAASVATSDPNKSVTISASKPVVVYGHTVTLSGKITPPATNQK